MSERPPSETPYLHVREVDGFLFRTRGAIAVTGNARGLLQLRSQIEDALRGRSSNPFTEGIYHDRLDQPFELAVKRARSFGDVEESAPVASENPRAYPVVPATLGG